MATAGRKKGTKKTGGRVAGTPNKEKPLKTFLREHSLDYFTPDKDPKEIEGFEELAARNPGRLFSQYELDLLCMKPTDRAKAELELLNYHTPKMQSTSVDMTMKEEDKTVTDRITRLASGQSLDREDDE